MGFFLRFIFGPGIFWGFDICSHSIIPAAWNPKYPPWYCSLRCFALLSFFFLCQDVSETEKEEAQAALEENVLKWVLCDIITINIIFESFQ